MTAAAQLRSSLEGLSAALESFQFRVPGTGQAAKERSRAELVRSIREYLLPRLDDPDAPVVAVLVGPTGSGKSIMLNSLAGQRASEPGALRPTTRSPVVWTNRRHARRYQTLLGGLIGRENSGVVAGDDGITDQLTVIDAPDFDSVYADSRVIGEQVLAVADLCIFVASALRYADGAAWEFLDQIRLRGLPILFVLNRLGPDPEARKLILGDFAAMLKDRDLLLEADSSLIFDVSEQVVYPRHGGLHADAVAAIRQELALISDPGLRRAVVRQSTEGAVAEVIEKVGSIVDGIAEDRSIVTTLHTLAEEAYAAELTTSKQLVQAGSLMTPVGVDSREALQRELASALSRRCGVAARNAAAAWDSTDEGHALLQVADTLWRHGAETPAVAEGESTAWLDAIGKSLEATVRRARPRRKAAAALATALLSGQPSEEGEADAQAALVADLEDRVATVLAQDADRFLALTQRVAISDGLGDTISALAAEVSAGAGEFYR
ncbi:MAG: GTPase domain-containing protein [Acidimicrobiia bacterium]|nr:GTPase domain-containing protein [Acidimicrobiia bacterium]